MCYQNNNVNSSKMPTVPEVELVYPCSSCKKKKKKQPNIGLDI